MGNNVMSGDEMNEFAKWTDYEHIDWNTRTEETREGMARIIQEKKDLPEDTEMNFKEVLKESGSLTKRVAKSVFGKLFK